MTHVFKIPRQVWSWLVFFVSIGAYVPLAVGGWQHPIEINIAAYGLWLTLAVMFAYSTHSQGFSGWRLPLGFLVGNGLMIGLGLARKGYTFNLGQAETTVLYGIIATLSMWIVVGTVKKKWDPRILYLGGIAADILSFYPQLKQYLLPHEPPTGWLIMAWTMFGIGTFVNFAIVESLFSKLIMSAERYEHVYEKEKRVLLILEESAFSVENFTFIVLTTLVMAH